MEEFKGQLKACFSDKNKVSLKRGVYDLLMWIRLNLPLTTLAICTNNSEENVRLCLRANGIDDSMFTLILGDSQLEDKKPSPKVYEATAEKALGVEKLESRRKVLIVEDWPECITNAKRAGFTVCAVRDSMTEDPEVWAATKKAADFSAESSLDELTFSLYRLNRMDFPVK